MEQQCVDRAARDANDELAQIAKTPDSLSELRTKVATTKARRQIAECKAEADHLNEQLSSQEREQYRRQGEEKRERISLMMILTTSRH